MKQLGDILLEGGLLTTEQLQAAVEEQRRLGRSLGRVLVDLGVLSEGQLVAALAQQIGLRFVDLTDHPVDPAAVALVPEAVCRRHTALPLGDEDGRLLVAMADPADVRAVDDLRATTGRDVTAVVATKPDVLAAIDRHHRSEVALRVPGGDDPADGEPARLPQTVEDEPVARLVDRVVEQAVQARASDVHLEPDERDLRVRLRIDGVLHERLRTSRSTGAAAVSRLKALAGVDVDERRLPQEGRFTVTAAGRRVDLQLVTLPTVWGEKIVLRVLDACPAPLGLADLGLSEANAVRYGRCWAQPSGLVLVTGPVGSGRSTTLYATLDAVRRPEIDVSTVEEPVERRRLPGVTQVQTDAEAGFTPARALRAVLRADPDVVLLTEVRDAETARLAVEAALTGHLLLSALAADDAPSAVARLTGLGVEPFLVGSALQGVLAQRLARRLCRRCRAPYVAAPARLREVGLAWPPDEPPPTLYRAVGCAACAGTGYGGRLALHEVMVVSEEVERLAATRASAATIGRLAREQGMVTLREDGLSKVLAGATSLEELLRVAG